MYKMTPVARSVVPGVRKCLGLRLQICRASKRSGKDKSNTEFIPSTQELQATRVQITRFLTVFEHRHIFQKPQDPRDLFTPCTSQKISSWTQCTKQMQNEDALASQEANCWFVFLIIMACIAHTIRKQWMLLKSMLYLSAYFIQSCQIPNPYIHPFPNNQTIRFI